MKEIRKLAEKNNCFGEVNYDSLTKRMKNEALPLLMLMVAKRNGIIKSRGVANGSAQKIHTIKEDFRRLLHAFVYLSMCVLLFLEREGMQTQSNKNKN